MNISSVELLTDFLKIENILKLCTLYTARVNDACLPHHPCPGGGSIPGPTGPEASAVPLSHGPPVTLSITQRLMTDLGLSVDATTVVLPVLLTWGFRATFMLLGTVVQSKGRAFIRGSPRGVWLKCYYSCIIACFFDVGLPSLFVTLWL